MLRLAVLGLVSCASVAPAPGERLHRRGEEIAACGQLFHAGTRVVLWNDPEGFDAYRTHWLRNEETRAPRDHPDRIARFGSFRRGLPPDVGARVKEEGWRLADLQQVVSQVVLHYDAAGSAARCFHVLHHVRGLSAHFLLDADGTVYQTLDLKERAWHAGSANDRSIGIEIANVGAYADRAEVERIHGLYGPAGVPLVEGEVHGGRLYQYAYTDAQYEALARLLQALVRVFPLIRPDAPRDGAGRVATGLVADATAFGGLVAHYHLTRKKVDPGPAFDWDRVLGGLE